MACAAWAVWSVGLAHCCPTNTETCRPSQQRRARPKKKKKNLHVILIPEPGDPRNEKSTKMRREWHQTEVMRSCSGNPRPPRFWGHVGDTIVLIVLDTTSRGQCTLGAHWAPGPPAESPVADPNLLGAYWALLDRIGPLASLLTCSRRVLGRSFRSSGSHWSPSQQLQAAYY